MNIYFSGMLVSMAIYILVGFLISRGVKGANDFYVAGRNAPSVLIIGSLVASYCSTGLFMGDAAEAYRGIFAPLHIVGVMQVAGYILGGVFFGRYLRRSGVMTIPEFFEKRFCSRAMGILATVTELFIIIIYMLSTMQGIGSLMNYVTGVDYNICILLALLTFTVLTAMSGAKGVLITDTIMFGIFTIAALVSMFFIIRRAGGWFHAVDVVSTINPFLLAWTGDLTAMYSTGTENLIWGLLNGIVWLSVCMIAPWQCSRYLMAKNEHVVVRSSVWAALGVFVLEFVIEFGAVLLNIFDVDIVNTSFVMIWSAMNILPLALGVLLLTGVLAAGISSATTFLSIIGSAIGNDIFKIQDDRKKLMAGRIAIVCASAIIMALAWYNPPQIFWVMYLGATVLACSWLPVGVASIWSKRITKTGAFCGMLAGFLGCSGVKLYSAISSSNLPLYVDSFVVGIIMNIIAMVVGSCVTKVTPEETKSRERLFIIPATENVPAEIVRTKRTLLMTIPLGGFVTMVLLIFWVMPYYQAIGR